MQLSFKVAGNLPNLYRDFLARIEGGLPKAAAGALKKAMPVLEKALIDSASGGSLTGRSGDLAKSIKTIYFLSIASGSIRARIYCDPRIAPHAGPLERGDTITSTGHRMFVPFSQTNPWYSLSGHLQRQGSTLKDLYGETFVWKSPGGNWIVAIEDNQEVVNLGVYKYSVKMPETKWFSRGIDEGTPEFYDTLIENLSRIFTTGSGS